MVGEWVETVDYPQAPKMTDEEVAALFDEALFARFATINRGRDCTAHTGIFQIPG